MSNNNFDKNNNTDYSYYSKILGKPFDTLNELHAAEALEAEKKKAKEEQKTTRKAEAEQVEQALATYRATAKKADTEIANVREESFTAIEAIKKDYHKKVDSIEKSVAAAKKDYTDKLAAFTKKYGGFHTTVKDGDLIATVDVDTSGTLIDSFFDLFGSIFNWSL